MRNQAGPESCSDSWGGRKEDGHLQTQSGGQCGLWSRADHGLRFGFVSLQCLVRLLEGGEMKHIKVA